MILKMGTVVLLSSKEVEEIWHQDVIGYPDDPRDIKINVYRGQCNVVRIDLVVRLDFTHARLPHVQQEVLIY